ncbi:MAG: hypothetical protein Q4F13_08895 [Pseudomonadota bacterium]|nr:hypothetical protein [Pseudomonadota bacterium]
MNDTKLSPPHVAVILAQLLERMEAGRAPVDAHQYRAVATRLGVALQDTGVDFSPLLQSSTAAAHVYENLHYAHAGLCCAPLDQAANAELAARQAIERARRQPSPSQENQT